MQKERDVLKGLENWLVGALTVVVAYVGLLLAARAEDGTMSWVGFVFFVGAVLFGFDLIRRATGHTDDSAG